MNFDPDDEIAYFARTNFRDDRRVFGIRQRDRRYHIYILGKTGTGKSTLIETLASEDIRVGRGFMLIDPHGDLYEAVRERIPDYATEHLIDLDLPRAYRRLTFNPLHDIPDSKRLLTASSLLNTFKKLWSSYWGPRMEHFLRNALLSLLEVPGSTLGDIPRLFRDAAYRSRVVSSLSNEEVRRFWKYEYEKIPFRYRAEAISPILNRTGAFLSNPVTHELLTSNREQIDLREVLDRGMIFLVNLAKGELGEDTTSLVGGLLSSSFEVAALSRADIAEHMREDFNVYLDEFHTYSTSTISSMMAELRKFRVCLTLSHQFLSSVDADVRDGILGNAGTIICFRLGSSDAMWMTKEFYPKFSLVDFENLPNWAIYVRLMIDGEVSKPFSASTLSPTHFSA